MSQSHPDAGQPAPESTRQRGALAIEPILAFRDNYIWLITRGARAAVVDPGDAQPVLEVLRERQLRLDAIVVTHHHPDHVGGVHALVRACGAPVMGPAHTPFDGIDLPLEDGARVQILDEEFQVLSVPGHTLDHIAYWSPALAVLFCGDTLFAGGCGRLFEGSPAQMHASLRRLAALPENTRVYCAHEYTLSNLRFALVADPGNAALRERQERCAALREQGRPTVPSTMGEERQTNPFLRCAELRLREVVQDRMAKRNGVAQADEIAVFAALRAWKDVF